MRQRKVSVLTAPNLDFLKTTSTLMSIHFPQLKRLAGVTTDTDRAMLRSLNIQAVIDRGEPRGVELAAAVLEQLGVSASEAANWKRQIASPMIGRTESNSEVASNV
jgi:hypothetical protein